MIGKDAIEIGNEVKVTPLGSTGQAVGGDKKKKNPTFKGHVVGLYPNFFTVDNGQWKESFCYRDIGINGGIQVKQI
jgi:hypothetical protein